MSLTNIILAAIVATLVVELASAGVIHFARRRRSRNLLRRIRSYTA